MTKSTDYREGPKARKAFDTEMSRLFQVSKEAAKDTSASKTKAPARKPKKTAK